MFACLIVFHLLKHLKCLHVSLFSSALPLFACMCPFPALRDHSVKRRLSHLIQFCPIYILAVSHINTFIPGGYGNSAIEKKTRHVNDSLQDFNSGIPLCFKAGLEMIPSLIDMHHQIQFTLSRGMVRFQTLTKALLTPRKQQGCPPWHLGTLVPWHIIKPPSFPQYMRFLADFSISDDGEGADVEP